jgi:hypothetical protein
LSFTALANKRFEEKIKKEGNADCTVETIERCNGIFDCRAWPSRRQFGCLSMAERIKKTTPIPPPNSFDVLPAFEKLETALAELAAAGSSVMTLIASEARRDVPHADRADSLEQ